MKDSVRWGLLFFLAILGATAVALALGFFIMARAQEPAGGTTKMAVNVLRGSTLWDFTEQCGHNGTDWPGWNELNPWLPKPEKVGLMTRVMLYPEGDHRAHLLMVPDGWDCSGLNPVVASLVPAPAPEGTTPPLPKLEEIPPVSVVPATATRSIWWTPDWLLWIIFIMAALLFILWLGGSFRNLPSVFLRRRRDPRRYPAVINGGLSSDPVTAAAQIEAAYPGRRIAKVERGYFVQDSGPERLLVSMATGSGINSNVYLKPGDQVFRVTLLDGVTMEYYL